MMNQDYEILRTLGKKVADIAAMPIQQEKKKLWIASNDLKPIRPMVYIDQLPWHEINTSEEMHLQCKDAFLRTVEQRLRETLYRWNHFPCDMVVENRIDLPHAIHNFDYGIHIVEDTRKTDDANDVVSHKYADQLATQEQLDALQNDKIWVDEALDAQRLALCSEIFAGILTVRFEGVQIHAGVWDRIAQMRPAEAILWDIVDRPEFIEATVKKMVDLTMSTVDQCEALGLLDPLQQYVHCTGAYTNSLPTQGSEGTKPCAKNVWSFGMAQLFATVSPAMHEEYEIDLVKPLYERFGLLYYGCCEPLENKIGIIRKLNNVRKISISPWANAHKSAENIGREYVLSYKSNPAYVAAGHFDEANIRKDMEHVLVGAKRNHTPIEFILKDVSTVCYHLEYIDQWEKIAMRIALNA